MEEVADKSEKMRPFNVDRYVGYHKCPLPQPAAHPNTAGSKIQRIRSVCLDAFSSTDPRRRHYCEHSPANLALPPRRRSSSPLPRSAASLPAACGVCSRHDRSCRLASPCDLPMAVGPRMVQLLLEANRHSNLGGEETHGLSQDWAGLFVKE
ncbi:Os01g0220900 [Oryza sativa Japonica Group]|uniref:Os01g0220900 protein n=1 Tax=Oryza sativa subsp. japonica TaxID=39947 RepID=A0A0P0UZU5_ORYSJ|nr:hypothetical protein EE612_001112 [Oryza sativa]BAS71072.1 Os01g0220900 [Oryza sativa Japonica Group]